MILVQSGMQFFISDARDCLTFYPLIFGLPANHNGDIVVLISIVVTNRSAIHKDIAHASNFPSTKLNTLNWKGMISSALKLLIPVNVFEMQQSVP